MPLRRMPTIDEQRFSLGLVVSERAFRGYADQHWFGAA
jgi:hypothetical protein